jgi:hypothetical protein
MRTLDEIRDEIAAMEPGGDTEGQHARADDLLMESLVLLGRPDIADAFRKAMAHFWYA